MMHQWLKPLKLKGGITLPHRIMPGPMDGLMSPLFCKVVNQLNLVDYWITPFIRLNETLPKTKILKKYLENFNINRLPVIIQLLGNKPARFANAAKVFEDLGVAGVNLNFCCPSRKVVTKNCGAKLLTQIDLMLEIIADIANATPSLSLSVKLRSGFSSHDEMSQFLHQLAITDLDFIMLHFRTAKEMYQDIFDPYLRIAQAVKLSYPIPLIASGDIFSVDSAKTAFENSSCAGITVARGLLKDPLLIRKIHCELGDSSSGGPMLQKDDIRNLFFQTMCDIVKVEPKYFSRSKFIEIARFMWSRDSDIFNKIISLNDDDMLTFSNYR